MSRDQFRLPGAVCRALANNSYIDASGWCGPNPRAPGGAGRPDSPGHVTYWRDFYLAYARAVSRAMEARAVGESGWNWIGQSLDGLDGDPDEFEPVVVESYLGGAFLRMYLDHRVDPALVAEAGQAIGESDEFGELRAGFTTQVQSVADRATKKLDTESVRKLAQQHFAKLMTKGVKIKETLNPVIGGVGGIEIASVELVAQSSLDSRGMCELTFRVQLLFKDEYDFQNGNRERKYDNYRRHLATLLQADKFAEFNLAYFREAHPVSALRTADLKLSSTFASFMYALERKGWTPPPLAWQVLVPMDVTVQDRASRPTR